MHALLLIALLTGPAPQAHAFVLWNCDCSVDGEVYQTWGSSLEKATRMCIDKGGTPDNCAPDLPGGNEAGSGKK